MLFNSIISRLRLASEDQFPCNVLEQHTLCGNKEVIAYIKKFGRKHIFTHAGTMIEKYFRIGASAVLRSTLALMFFLASPMLVFSASTFIHLTDTHIRSQESIERFRSVIDDIETLNLKPDFIINSGDITELGSLPEYKSYKQIVDSSAYTFYHLIGNHDVRWSNVGKKRFIDQLGPLYQSLDLGSVQLILLDTGVLLEQYGHFSLESLNWLKTELASIEKTKPIILAGHHPPFLSSRYIDNELELFKIIADYNVILFLCGHGHQNKHWTVNGIDFFMTKAVMAEDPGYRIIKITDKNEIQIYTRTISSQSKLELTRSLTSRRLDIDISVRSPRVDRCYDDNLPILMTIRNVDEAEISIDQRNWISLKQSGSKFLTNFDISYLPPGQHTLLLKVNDNNGRSALRLFEFEIDRHLTQLAFKAETRGEIQSTPLIHENAIIFGSNDGFLYNLDSDIGTENWKFATRGPVTTRPLIVADTLFFTSGDGYCYALDSETGAPYWKVRIAESIYSSPDYANGRLFFGSSDSCMNCISATDGSLIWKFKTGGFIKVKPAVKFGKIAFGAWDGYFYCLSQQNGDLLWKKQISETFYYSPATSNPLIASDKVYFASHDHKVHALHIHTGDIIWEHSAKDHQPGYSSPANFDDKIVLGSLSGHLFALAEDDGQEIWTSVLSDSLDPVFDSSPVVGYPQVIVGSVNGNLYSTSIETGERLWSYRLNHGYIFATPAIKDDIAYIGSTDGYFYAIRFLQTKHDM
ncbi:PQQ-binding-like beta-propeller repeat protein [candidate division KSB1 bacterium]|nr:PQQ-binding-like beta-propeller repeat protein [candidate division KSB1 bacterium]